MWISTRNAVFDVSVFPSPHVVLCQRPDSQSSAAVRVLRVDIRSSKDQKESAAEAVCIAKAPFSRKMLSDVFWFSSFFGVFGCLCFVAPVVTSTHRVLRQLLGRYSSAAVYELRVEGWRSRRWLLLKLCVCNRSPVFQENVIRLFHFQFFLGFLGFLSLRHRCVYRHSSVSIYPCGAAPATGCPIRCRSG